MSIQTYTESEIDVVLEGNPISIKTITGNNLNGVKAVWTVDPESARKFMDHYKPKCDILLAQICWKTDKGPILYTN